MLSNASEITTPDTADAQWDSIALSSPGTPVPRDGAITTANHADDDACRASWISVVLKTIFGTGFLTMVLTFFIGNTFLEWSNSFLGVLILIYFGIQFVFAVSNFLWYKKITEDDESYSNEYCFPTISFNIVGYREDPDYWTKCLLSLRDIDYPKSRINGVFAFIDGDEEDDQYMKNIFGEVLKQDIEVGTAGCCDCFLMPHKGKRHVMYEGFRYIREKFPNNEYIIVIDSDTILRPDSVRNLVKAVHWNRMNGCGTGSLKIFNRSNLLTRIVHSRYGYAFNIERGAMSYVGCMNCCSGPFSIYRQRLLDDDLLESFLTQMYCGRNVGPGDDRHLTNLILYKGFRSVQTPFAIAETESPEHFRRFLTQQLRWMRSFYREILWQIRAIPFQHFYLIIITTYELLFPFFILMSIISQIMYVWSFALVFRRFVYAMLILFVRTLLLMLFYGGDIAYIFNVCYFPMYFLFLLPTKMFALMTPYRMGWMTSDRKTVVFYNSIETVGLFMFILIWFGALCYSVYTFRHGPFIFEFSTPSYSSIQTNREDHANDV